MQSFTQEKTNSQMKCADTPPLGTGLQSCLFEELQQVTVCEGVPPVATTRTVCLSCDLGTESGLLVITTRGKDRLKPWSPKFAASLLEPT